MTGSKVEAVAPVSRGPKARVEMSYLDLSMLPKNRNWKRVKAFAEQFLHIPAGKNARQPVKFMPWEIDYLKGVFPGRGKRPTQSLLVCGRGNGKSFLASVVLLYLLFADETESPQLSVVAKDIRQANHIIGAMRRMIEVSPELACRTKLHSDGRIITPFNNGLCQPLPGGDPDALQGFAGTFVVDELHVVGADSWAAALFGATKIEGSQVLAFSTPPANSQSVLWQLAEQAKTSPSPDFHYVEYSGDLSHPVSCRHCWKAANPSLGHLLTEDQLESSMKSSSETMFRRMRLAEFNDKTDDKWLSVDDLSPLLTNEPIAKGSRIILALDGSITDDATVLVGCTIEDTPKIQLLQSWIPAEHDENYRIDPEAVMAEVRKIARDYKVIEFVADPAHYELPLAMLSKERAVEVVHFPQNDSRMGGPTVTMYTRIRQQTVKFVRDDTLIEHFLNAHFTETQRGGKIHKGLRKNKIDTAVAAVMAMSRALFHDSKPKRVNRMVGFK